MQCEHPRCKRRARYVSPANWCGTHWKKWWDWGERHGLNNKREPKWMREPRSRHVKGLVEMYKRAAFSNT